MLTEKAVVTVFTIPMTSNDPKASTTKRPPTVSFNVEVTRPKTFGQPSMESFPRLSKTEALKQRDDMLKTADLSHISDLKPKASIPTFIPKEFTREISTPIPLRPGTSTLDPEQNQWKTTVFPSINAGTREEVSLLEQWLNEVLEKNKQETKDPIELAKNARHWFTIAYNELCRQVALECPDRSQLLQSIWKRYQDLFSRVVQLHQEEKSYLLQCHQERTSKLKEELENCQAKLKAISQQYRDDQERWSNSREREEAKFTNLRKKLDLQVKNRRNLLMQIKSLKEKLGQPASEVPEEKIVEAAAAPIATQQQLSDKVQALRQKVRTDLPKMADVAYCLDDVAHIIEQDRATTAQTLDYYPSILKDVSPSYVTRKRSIDWAMASLTYFYGHRLNDLCDNRTNFDYEVNRHHFGNQVYEHLLTMFGSPIPASEAFIDLIETLKELAKNGNERSKLFLQFLDIEQPYKDSVELDFYCYCLGSIAASNTARKTIFPDTIENGQLKIATMSGSVAFDMAKKVLHSICEAETAGAYLEKMKSGKEEVRTDELLDELVEVYNEEEKRVTVQLKEQYEMDAAQYRGIVTLGQFQTLAMFSSKKLEYRAYTEMMKETLMRTNSATISFKSFVETMHRHSMLVPFGFDRIDYSLETHLDDLFGFMKLEYEYHKEELAAKLEKARKSDDALFKQLNAAKAKFEQFVESKRAGFFTEVGQRELYEKLRSAE